MKLLSPALCLSFVILAAYLPDLRAGDATKVALQPGIRLLEIELVPSKVTLRTTKCDPLVIAVSKTTLEHPDDTLSILRAALTRGITKKESDGKDVVDVLLPCPCARRLFLASVAAAPARASDILDLAVLLYPDCGREFEDALQDYNNESNGLSRQGPPGSPNFISRPPEAVVVVPPVPLSSVVNG